jgi:hypothetical protein
MAGIFIEYVVAAGLPLICRVGALRLALAATSPEKPLHLAPLHVHGDFVRFWGART